MLTNGARLGAAALFLALFAFAPQSRAAEEEARVVILNGVDPYLPAYLVMDSAMRASLATYSARRVAFFSEPLDAQRFPVQALEPEFVALMTKKYHALRINVVVAVTRPAIDFYQRHGQALWPGARLVFHSVGRNDIDLAKVPPNAIGVVARRDIRGTIDIARRLQPDARRILVISGASELDMALEREAREVLAANANTAGVEFLSGWPLPELLVRVAAEPATTIILYLTQFRDRDGRPHIPGNVQRALSGASGAPIYSPFETHLGAGAAAGSVESFEETGRLAGEQVRAALDKGLRAQGPTVLEVPSRCVANARALQRWSMDERRLPDGCEIRFADSSYWRENFWQIAAALAVIVGQGLLIATLFAQRRHRRVAEGESRKRYAEMTHMNRRVAMGELSASIAHELNQPLGAIRNNAGAAEILLKADPPRLQEVAEILDDIKRDDQRASDVIARFRKMLQKAEFEVKSLDLNDAIGETVRLLESEASAKEISLKTELDPRLPEVSADRVQVQQVILNLTLNAMDAMHNQPANRRALVIRSASAGRREAEVSVTDTGPGIPAEMLDRVFDPFVTTKASGMGLGLAISRTIVEAHGGHIRAENAPGGGAVLRFTLPFASPRST
jgi:signal transduction histidine kinase